MKESKRQNLIEQKETQSNKTFLEAFSPFFAGRHHMGSLGGQQWRWPHLWAKPCLVRDIGQLFSGGTGAEQDVP
jgi:hypothetical protein